ncbi:glycosyltransferase [Leptolyngbya sp. FACHB-541]|uniref:glycosyltransferase n=1 Tax=Leptolyngbya sp. FACHB-541 TaxID=2692810 RepID=UPI0016899F71|nr:glycosyltransferase [Leptolyngbya sp. FACHB-541]MBD1995861.1 glycosyltransferase [Leptolyngbya sp. FACHB-541]
MKHLIICGEYPPAPFPPGGIGTYVMHIARLLAESGETVHVITQLWAGAAKQIEEKCQGRLIIHRVPLDDWDSFLLRSPNSEQRAKEVKALSQSCFPAQAFSWQASLLAEQLVEEEGIDLIEAQDYEAPLYYFQLRRALGLGPKQTPPCLIHLHSPTEFIAQHNDWDISLPNLLTAKRLEDYSIGAADALLCPSQYFASQAETHYGLTKGSIQVIPLPIGDNPTLKRDSETWQQGNISYIGRLERRKGVLEWIEAAVEVAESYPTAQFEFIGTNCLGSHRISGEEFVERQIPDHLKARFHFRGRQNRSVLPRFLRRSRVAVVPSRWENFPNTCVEAMCSGLPVIASPEGGMVEMIKDGETGWLANSASSQSLATVLKRALETPSAEMAEMGDKAAFSIRQMCDNERILEKHLELRQQLVDHKAKRSLCLPVNLPWQKQPLSNESAHRVAKTDAEGIAVVVSCFNDGEILDKCLQSLANQSQKPIKIVIVDSGSTDEQTLKGLRQAEWDGLQIIQNKKGDPVSAKNLGIKTILQSECKPLGFAFFEAKHIFYPNFIETCESTLRKCPEVGVVSCWAREGGSEQAWVKPCPSFPYQWLTNEAVPFSVVRTETLHEVNQFRAEMHQGYEDWDLLNAILAAGWVAVTLPEILADDWSGNSSVLNMPSIHAHGRMRREMLERFPGLVARDAQEIALLSSLNPVPSIQQELSTPQGKQFLTQIILSSFKEATLRILGKVKSTVLQVLSSFLKPIRKQAV